MVSEEQNRTEQNSEFIEHRTEKRRSEVKRRERRH